MLSSVLSFILWLDGGQRMRAELLFVRGIDFDCADRSEDGQRTGAYVVMFRKDNHLCRSAGAPHGGLWSVTSGRCPVPLAWRTLVH